MSYFYERFGEITLPIFNRDANLAPAAAKARIVSAAAGAFDADGSGRSAQQFPHSLSIDAFVSEDDAAAQRVLLDAVRAAVGTRAYLYRRADDDETVQRAHCRLVNLTIDRSYKQRRAYQPIRMEFQQLEAWAGTATSWVLDDGEVLDDGLTVDASDYSVSLTSVPALQTIEVGGNLPVTDAILTVTAGSAALSNPAFTATDVDLRWTGTIPIGQSLVIDCGAASVLLAGADAYSGLSLGAGHAIEEWLRLEPGSTPLTLNVSGTLTGASWSVYFRERWA